MSLLLLVTVMVIGIGYYVLQQKNASDGQSVDTTLISENEKPISSEAKPQEINSSDVITALGEDNEVALTISTDLKKLPNDVPESFISYMQKKLEKNDSKSDSDCIQAYIVSTYSDLNISGRVGSIQKNGEVRNDCIGGAAMFWYYQEGKWGSLGTQALVSCEKIAKTTIYAEFMPDCAKNDRGDLADNPNGSIVDALR